MDAVDPLEADLFPDLSDRQRETLPVVLAAPTLTAGFQAASISRSTWYRWRRERPFRDAVHHLQREVLRENLADLQAATRYAVTGLLSLLTSKNESIKLSACRDVLTLAIRSHEVLDVEDRIGRLEDALQPLISAADL